MKQTSECLCGFSSCWLCSVCGLVSSPARSCRGKSKGKLPGSGAAGRHLRGRLPPVGCDGGAFVGRRHVSDVLCKSLTLAAMEKQLGWHKSEAGRPFGTNFTLLKLAFLSIRGS